MRMRFAPDDLGMWYLHNDFVAGDFTTRSIAPEFVYRWFINTIWPGYCETANTSLDEMWEKYNTKVNGVNL